MDGSLSIGQADRLQHARRPVQRPVAARRAAVAGIPAGRHLGTAVGRSAECPRPRPSYQPNRSTLPSLAGHIKFGHCLPLPCRQPRGAQKLSLDIPGRQCHRHRRPLRFRQSTLAKLVSACTCRRLGASTSTTSVSPSSIRPGCAGAHRRVCCRTSLFNRSITTTSRSPTRACLWNRWLRRRAWLRHAHRSSPSFPQGYDTIVGEHGATLSGGQRQRIAIARALVTNQHRSSTEITSALDYESESIVQQNLARICKSRTVILIAHRLSTVRDADHIVVLDQRPDRGTRQHGELLKIVSAPATGHR